MVAVTEYKRPQNFIIEYYTLFANYNRNDNELIFQWDDAGKYTRQGFNKNELISVGLNQLKQNIEHEIASSCDDLKINSLPLNKREVRIDTLDLLQTLPNFDKIQKQFLENTICLSLKDRIRPLNEIEVNLRTKK